MLHSLLVLYKPQILQPLDAVWRHHSEQLGVVNYDVSSFEKMNRVVSLIVQNKEDMKYARVFN